MKDLPSQLVCLKKFKSIPSSNETGRKNTLEQLMLTHVKLSYEARDIVVFEVLGE